MKEIVEKIKNRGVGIIPTDTLYGLVGVATSPNVIKRIYDLKHRDPDKPFIILISSIDDLKKFAIKLNDKQYATIEKYWPGSVSIILPCATPNVAQFEYLHRGTKHLAFRLPADKKLRDLLIQTGPLVAPSANPEGEIPATAIKQAREYFGNQIDFYIDGGTLKSEPSTLVRLDKTGGVETIRQGLVEIK